MATKIRGFSDIYHNSRINHLNGTGYPAAITTPYVGVYLGSLPLSDGSGVTDTVRTAVTWTAPIQDPNTQRWYIQPTAAVAFTVPAGIRGTLVGWGVYSAASGGVPIYADAVPSTFAVNGGSAGQSLSLPPQTFRVWAEGAL